MKIIKACIFDLDGVIVDTAKYHYKAWKRLANELGFDFTEEENEQLKGVSRTRSLELILNWGGIEKTDEEREALANMKNEWYLEFILRMNPDEVLPGVINFLDEIKSKKVKIGLGSASKNAKTILERVNLLHYFDIIIDGNDTTKSKPDPEVFLMGAEQLEVKPKEAIVFEDAEKGLTAALDGGFYTVGVGDNPSLDNAHIIIPSFEYIDYQEILEALSSTLSSKN
jgi:beta-phosphoglucomutase